MVRSPRRISLGATLIGLPFLFLGSVSADDALVLPPLVRLAEDSSDLPADELALSEPRADRRPNVRAGAANPAEPPPDLLDGAGAVAANPRRGVRAARLFEPWASGDTSRRESVAYNRAASLPDMLGHSFDCTVVPMLLAGSGMEWALPLAAGSRRNAMAENNKALPEDRVFFSYNHFENALHASDVAAMRDALVQRGFPVDRYTFGIEKTFRDAQWSIAFSLPLAGAAYTGELFAANGGSIGNLSIILKRLCYESDWVWISAGLGIEAPTGAEANGGFPMFEPDFIHVRNEAVQLAPYLAFLCAPGDRFFYQGFLEVNTAVNGNRVSVVAPMFSETLGTLHDQTLLRGDLAAGWWLWHDPELRRLPGLAWLTELHYTTALQEANGVDFSGSFPYVTNPANRFDMISLTTGLHAEVTHNTVVRVATALPLRTGDNRTFDAEVMVQLQRRF